MKKNVQNLLSRKFSFSSMEFGIQVENTPFTPFKFQSEKDISFQQIMTTLNEKPKNISVVVFSQNPISVTDSSIQSKHFKIMPNGFPSSVDFLLFKFFVSQSLISNHLVKIAVISANDFFASSYVIARWLIDEKGINLTQAIEALRKSFSIGFIEIDLKEKLTQMYIYEGPSIFLKTNRFPVNKEQDEVGINLIIQDDNQQPIKTNSGPKPKPPPPPPPPPPRPQLQFQFPTPKEKFPSKLQNHANSDFLYQKNKQQPQYLTNSSQEQQKYPLQKTTYKQSNDLVNQHEEIQFLNVSPQSQSKHRHHHHRKHEKHEQNPEVPLEQNSFYQYEENTKNSYDQPQSAVENTYDTYYQTPNKPDYLHTPPPQSDYPPKPDYYSDLYHTTSVDYQSSYYPKYDQTHQTHSYDQQQFSNYYQYDNHPNINSYQYDRHLNTNSYQYDHPQNTDYYHYDKNQQSTSYLYEDQQNHNSYRYDNHLNPNSYYYDHRSNVDPYHYEGQQNPTSYQYDHTQQTQYDHSIDYQYQTLYNDYPNEYYQNRNAHEQYPIDNQFHDIPKRYSDIYNQEYRKGIPQYSQNHRIIHDDITNPIPPEPSVQLTLHNQPEQSRILYSLIDDQKKRQSQPQTDIPIEKESIPLYSSSLLNNSAVDSDESDSNLKRPTDDQSVPNENQPLEQLKKLFSSSSIDSIESPHNVDNVSYQIFTHIPISRIGEDTSSDEYGEVCKDIASYLSIRNVDLQNIKSLPFTNEEQLTPESFNTFGSCIKKDIIIRPIPDGVRCFLVARGSKRFLISSEACREVKVSLFSINMDDVTQSMKKALFEGFLVRHKFDNNNSYFIITDCFYSNIDLSNYTYSARLEEAKKVVELQSKNQNQDNIILDTVETFPIYKFEELSKNKRFNYEVVGFSFLSPDATRQPNLNQFNYDDSDIKYQIIDTICCSNVFRWFIDGCPVVEININNSMKCVGLARRNNSDDLVEAVDFGFAKKSMLRFNKKIVDLEYSSNLSKWQIKCISSQYKTWYADDVKNVVCGKEVMSFNEVKQEIDEFVRKFSINNIV